MFQLDKPYVEETPALMPIEKVLGYLGECRRKPSMRVAGLNTNESAKAKYWVALIGGVIFTTLQMQDMPDV